MINKLRYWLLGKTIQKQMEKAEEAGREAAKWEYAQRLEKNTVEMAKTAAILNEKISQNAAMFAEEVARGVERKLASLDHTVNPEDVLTASYLPDGNTKAVFLGGQQLNSNEVRNLKSEVQIIKSSRIWNIINHTLKKQAEDIMFTKAASFDDMKAGKSMLRTLDIQRNILDTVEKFQ